METTARFAVPRDSEYYGPDVDQETAGKLADRIADIIREIAAVEMPNITVIVDTVQERVSYPNHPYIDIGDERFHAEDIGPGRDEAGSLLDQMESIENAAWQRALDEMFS